MRSLVRFSLAALMLIQGLPGSIVPIGHAGGTACCRTDRHACCRLDRARPAGAHVRATLPAGACALDAAGCGRIPTATSAPATVFGPPAGDVAGIVLEPVRDALVSPRRSPTQRSSTPLLPPPRS